jgi:site-specific DNA-methyltransferase (cytosine-N4-specific)
MVNKIYQEDCRKTIENLPDNFVDCVVTSPPYWAVRDYGKDTEFVWGEWQGQLGLEPSYHDYINHLCEIFDSIHRILKPSGTLWVNMGDTYGGSGDKGNGFDPKYKGRNGQVVSMNRTAPAKCLLQIPARFTIEMTNNGWILRNKIIWHKPNAMPSPVKDRFSVDYEEIFFFTKSKKYEFEQQFEPYLSEMNRWGGEKFKAENESIWDTGVGQNTYRERMVRPNPEGRNKRCVWSINTKPSKVKHFASYPRELIRTPIKAGCPKGGIVYDPFLGTGTTAIEAIAQGKFFIGSEPSQDYYDIANKRLQSVQQEIEL